MSIRIAQLYLGDIIASRMIQLPGTSLTAEVIPGMKSSSGWSLRRESTSNTWGRHSSGDGEAIEFKCRGPRLGLHLLRHRWSSGLEVSIGSETVFLDAYEAYSTSVYDTVFIIDGLPDGLSSIKLTNRPASANERRLGDEIWIMSLLFENANAADMPKLMARYSKDLCDRSVSDRLMNIHCKSTSNLGDRLSSPTRYFEHLRGVPVFDLYDWHPARQPDVAVRRDFAERVADSHVLIGGGGLLNSDVFAAAIDYITHASSKHIIIWGAGHNAYWIKKFSDIKQVCLIDHNKYSLVGVRDHLQPFLFCPCASAMHETLDSKIEVSRPVGIYSISERTGEFSELLRSDPEIPILTNDCQDMQEVVTFLSECSTVLTNSYHGAYWATLLNRRVVVCNPDSSKFFDMPFPLPMGHPLEWRKLEKQSRTYPEALSEARSANEHFFQLVCELCKL